MHVKCLLSNFSLPETNGLVFYNYDDKIKYFNASYNVSNYAYNPDTLCSKTSPQCALSILLKQLKYNTHIRIFNTTFSDMHNVTVLNYHGESHRVEQKILNIITFYNCKISKNTGNSFFKMFSFIINGYGYSFGSEFGKYEHQNHYNMINFFKCNFYNNSNFKSLLHILTINTLSSNALMKINLCNIYGDSCGDCQ